MSSVIKAEGRGGPYGRIGAIWKGPRAVRNVVVVETVAASHRHFAVSEDVPAETNSWRNALRAIFRNEGVTATMNLHLPIGDLFSESAAGSRSKEGEGSGGVVVIAPVTEVVVTESEVQGKPPGFFQSSWAYIPI